MKNLINKLKRWVARMSVRNTHITPLSTNSYLITNHACYFDQLQTIQFYCKYTERVARYYPETNGLKVYVHNTSIGGDVLSKSDAYYNFNGFTKLDKIKFNEIVQAVINHTYKIDIEMAKVITRKYGRLTENV